MVLVCGVSVYGVSVYGVSVYFVSVHGVSVHDVSVYGVTVSVYADGVCVCLGATVLCPTGLCVLTAYMCMSRCTCTNDCV